MGALLHCGLCREQLRLEIPLRFAPLMVFHAVIDHGRPIEGIERVHRTVLPSSDVSRGLG